MLPSPGLPGRRSYSSDTRHAERPSGTHTCSAVAWSLGYSATSNLPFLLHDLEMQTCSDTCKETDGRSSVKAAGWEVNPISQRWTSLVQKSVDNTWRAVFLLGSIWDKCCWPLHPLAASLACWNILLQTGYIRLYQLYVLTSNYFCLQTGLFMTAQEVERKALWQELSVVLNLIELLFLSKLGCM